ncbi:S-layer homology domain-containing protein [Paenibacillus sp. SI8]|uniref:S-layer homology domain-containing protein n=1 Tax=unclassified Paenibacillus TaxID=185978 RepID=UPI003465DE65
MLKEHDLNYPVLRKFSLLIAMIFAAFAWFLMHPGHSSAQTVSVEVYVDENLVQTISSSDLVVSNQLTPNPISYSTVNNKSGQTRYYSAKGVTLEDLLTKPAFGVKLRKEDIATVKIIGSDQYAKTFSSQDVFSLRYYYPAISADSQLAVSVPAMLSTSWAGSISTDANKFESADALGFFIGQSFSSEKTNSLFVKNVSTIRVTTATSKKSPFTDIDNHPAKEDLNILAAKGYLSGIEGDHFDPKREITRAEFTSILVKSLGINKLGEVKTSFRDISLGDAYYSEVNAAHEQGIVAGFEDNVFAPNKKITHEEALTMITRAIEGTRKFDTDITENELNHLESNYSDAKQISLWARGPMVIALKNNLVTSDKGMIFPKNSLTWAETATMFVKLLKNAGLL